MQLETAENPRAVIGGNSPPLSPFEQAEKEINDLYGECKLWLDGAIVDSQELADGIGNLLSMLRAAEARADEARIAEKKPLDEKIAEIQARYAPLIADTKALKGKTVLATAACKRALQPWLDAEQKRIQEAARIAREEADRKEQEARDTHRKAQQAADLEASEQAEALLAAAKKANTAANKAEKRTATAGGTMGRAIGLRTVRTVAVMNGRDFARYVWTHHRSEMDVLLNGLAQRLFDVGHKDMPGVVISEQTQAA